MLRVVIGIVNYVREYRDLRRRIRQLDAAVTFVEQRLGDRR